MGKRKVLVVDDIFANQFLLASMLEEMDCNIRTASNGQEVFDALADEMFDIIFMDIEMPVMNGIEATKKLKADPSNFESLRNNYPIRREFSDRKV